MKSRLVYQTLGMKTPAHTVDNAPHNALASSVLSERQQFTEPRLAEHCSWAQRQGVVLHPVPWGSHGVKDLASYL